MRSNKPPTKPDKGLTEILQRRGVAENEEPKLPKEEIQATNEELKTTNDERKVANLEARQG